MLKKIENYINLIIIPGGSAISYHISFYSVSCIKMGRNRDRNSILHQALLANSILNLDSKQEGVAKRNHYMHKSQLGLIKYGIKFFLSISFYLRKRHICL